MIFNFNVPVWNEEVYDSFSEIQSGFSHYANDCVHFRKKSSLVIFDWSL